MKLTHNLKSYVLFCAYGNTAKDCILLQGFLWPVSERSTPCGMFMFQPPGQQSLVRATVSTSGLLSHVCGKKVVEVAYKNPYFVSFNSFEGVTNDALLKSGLNNNCLEDKNKRYADIKQMIKQETIIKKAFVDNEVHARKDEETKS